MDYREREREREGGSNVRSGVERAVRGKACAKRTAKRTLQKPNSDAAGSSTNVNVNKGTPCPSRTSTRNKASNPLILKARSTHLLRTLPHPRLQPFPPSLPPPLTASSIHLPHPQQPCISLSTSPSSPVLAAPMQRTESMDML